MNDNTVQFAVYKVQGVDETDSGVTSVRDKLVTITFVGKSVPPLQRNFVIASKDARSSLFQGTAVDQQADDVDSVRFHPFMIPLSQQINAFFTCPDVIYTKSPFLVILLFIYL